MSETFYICFGQRQQKTPTKLSSPSLPVPDLGLQIIFTQKKPVDFVLQMLQFENTFCLILSNRNLSKTTSVITVIFILIIKGLITFILLYGFAAPAKLKESLETCIQMFVLQIHIFKYKSLTISEKIFKLPFLPSVLTKATPILWHCQI